MSVRLITTSALWVCAMLCSAGAASARLASPYPQTPGNNASVQSLPAFAWSAVRGAAQYEFEFAADSKFSSGVNGFGGEGDRINGTAITNDRTIPDGTYFWRVRAIDAKDNPGNWSATRILTKAWTATAALASPLGTTVTWPSNPLVLRWSPVPYATQYDVWIATDPGLSNLVIGSVGSPTQTQGTTFAFPTTLAPGQYYWAVTPVDAEGDRGRRSAVGSFTWVWPSTTTPSETNLAADPGVVDPQFSWSPVPGAASYQVEVNASQDFPAGSKWCCNDPTVGTSLSPTTLLANGTYYWRVRAIDVRGDAGVWNVGQPFPVNFDSLPSMPTVPNLTLRTTIMQPMASGSSTDTPIVTWDAVPGASSYEIQLTRYQGLGCDWTQQVNTYNTATNAWTPLGSGRNWGPSAWPGIEGEGLLPGGTYCFRLLARRDDGTQAGQLVSDWTQLGGFNQPGFSFTGPPTSTPAATQTPASSYLLPAGRSTTPRTPLFTWAPISGANGYYVIVSRDQNFTDVVDRGFTNVPAYAPRIADRAPYADETTAYWWAVVPSANADGSGVFSDPETGEDSPQTFNKASVPPTPLTPTNGTNVPTQPTFHWTSAEGARNYRLQIAEDPTFGSPLQDVTTDSTAYTSESTLPADKTLYWRVRANDTTGQGLDWSATSVFTHRLPVPAPAAGNPILGHSIPALAWTPVTGAVAYDMHVDQADGSTRDFTLDAPVMAPTLFYGTGVWRWEVRAEFPGGVTGGYFSPEQPYIRVIPAPSGVSAGKSGPRIIIAWASDPDAKQYRVQLSTTEGFSSPVASDTTDNTVWVPQVDPTSASKTLYWRLAAVDQGGNVGAYDSGVFNVPVAKKKPAKARKRRAACVATKHHRCPKAKRTPRRKTTKRTAPRRGSTTAHR